MVLSLLIPKSSFFCFIVLVFQELHLLLKLLSSAVYSICFLDDKGPTNIYKALQDDILDLTNHSLTVSFNIFLKKLNMHLNFDFLL